MLVRDVTEGQQRIPAFFSMLIYDVDDTTPGPATSRRPPLQTAR